MTDAIPREGSVLVRFIFPALDPAFRHPCFDLGSRAIEQRPYDPLARNRPYAGEAREAAAAQDTEEHGFGLVRPCVACSDAVDHPRLHQLAIELLADAPCRLLHVVVDRRYVGLAEMKRQCELPRERAYEISVGL